MGKKAANSGTENSCNTGGTQHRLSYSRGGDFEAIIASCVRSRGLWSIVEWDLGKVLWGAGCADAVLTSARREHDRNRIFSCSSL